MVEALITDLKNQIKKITGVNDFLNLESNIEDSVLTISFTVNTIYGEVGETVDV